METQEKRPIGRPPKYDKINGPTQMQADIDAYFKRCKDGKKIIVIRKGQPVETTKEIPKTVAGLAHALGFNSRVSLLNYTDKPEFMSIITRAKLEIEMDNVEGGMLGEYESRITTLNLASNYGYSTKNETEHSGAVDIKEIKINFVSPAGNSDDD